MALILAAILHFIPDEAGPCAIVAELVAALPPGSYLVMSHATNDFFHARSEAQFARFLDGFEPVPPGLTSVASWRADQEPEPRPTAAEAGTCGAGARGRGATAGPAGEHPGSPGPPGRGAAPALPALPGLPVRGRVPARRRPVHPRLERAPPA